MTLSIFEKLEDYLPFIILVSLLISMPTIIFWGLPILSNYILPTNAEHLQYQQVEKHILEMIKDPNTTCQDLRDMRTLLADNYWIGYGDKIRDMFNSMGCGNKWEWYED